MRFQDFVVGYGGAFTKEVTAKDNDQFAELSGDFNPLHFSDDFARRVGFDRRISNGFVTESRVAAALVRALSTSAMRPFSRSPPACPAM